MTESDHLLMMRIRDGDAVAFDLLFARHRETVRRYLGSIVREDAAAEDLTQEVFFKVWTRAEGWSDTPDLRRDCNETARHDGESGVRSDGEGFVRAWILRIAQRLALNHLRSLRRRRERPFASHASDCEGEEDHLSAREHDAVFDPETALVVTEQWRLFRSLMRGLPEKKRETLRLVVEEEMSLEDVSAALGVPSGTVKSRLHYARRILAQEWKEWEDE